MEKERYAVDDYLKYEQYMSRIVRVENGFIVIEITYPYEISLDRCKDQKDIIGWVLHLSKKTWMTKEAIARFIEIAHEANNISVPH